MQLFGVSLVTVVCALLATSAEGRKGFGPGEQEYGYVDVRPGAHMFYWLYYTTAAGTYTNRPLVMWLQGGPGASSTSYGNFEEIGPLTSDLQSRNTTWVQHVNLLLVDNPVGAGYSYVDKLPLLTTNNTQIAKDLVEVMRGFLKAYPSFQTVPFYVFCESYGGKMTAEFALELEKERKSGNIKVNFQGIGLGDSWISPIDSVMTWAPYLYQTGLLDQKGYKTVDEWARKTQDAVNDGRFYQATTLWAQTEGVIMGQAGGVDFYNILKPIPMRRGRSDAIPPDHVYLPTSRAGDGDLQKLMDGPVRLAFGNTIPSSVRHGSQQRNVFNYLHGDFMKPVTSVVEELLNTTDLKVVVYTGQLDLIVDTPGTVAWVDKLKWPMADNWANSAQRTPFVVNGFVEGFVKQSKNFSLYWINRAGHMVPADNPSATIEMLRIVTKFDKNVQVSRGNNTGDLYGRKRTPD